MEVSLLVSSSTSAVLAGNMEGAELDTLSPLKVFSPRALDYLGKGQEEFSTPHVGICRGWTLLSPELCALYHICSPLSLHPCVDTMVNPTLQKKTIR